jgi:flagellar M-ring protein FliF
MALGDRVKDSRLVQQVRAAWGRLPRGRRVLAGATVVAVLGLFGWVIVTGTRVPWRELMRGQTPQDAAAVRDALEKQGIPYRLEEGGVVLVPEDEIHRARLDVAQAGLPAGGSVGFEIFDRQDFWANTFSQRVNFHRALEGELSRTVTALDEVAAARVHLVIPKPTLFKEEQKHPTASIVVKLAGGRHLSEGQIHGLRLLVASAVEGMSPEDVTVLDSGGAALARPGSAGPLGGQDRRMELAQGLESSLESRIVSLLEPVAGAGRVVARVSADLDFTASSETVEQFDAENPSVLSERRSTESRGRTQPKASGVPGARGNTPGPGGAPADGMATESTDRQDELVNYALNKTMRHRDDPPGRLRRLSVAVLLAGRPQRRAAAEAGDSAAAAAPEYVPFSDEELTRFDTIVKSAVGFDARRGDVVEVIHMPFSGIEEEALLTEPLLPPGVLQRMLDWGFVLLLVAALYFTVVRPLLGRRATETAAAATAGAGAPALGPGAGRPAGLLGDGAEAAGAAGAGEAARLGAGGDRRALNPADAGAAADEGPGQPVPAKVAIRLRERAIELSRSDAKRAAQVIRAWLQTEDPRADG